MKWKSVNFKLTNPIYFGLYIVELSNTRCF